VRRCSTFRCSNVVNFLLHEHTARRWMAEPNSKFSQCFDMGNRLFSRNKTFFWNLPELEKWGMMQTTKVPHHKRAGVSISSSLLGTGYFSGGLTNVTTDTELRKHIRFKYRRIHGIYDCSLYVNSASLQTTILYRN
jgi:hypothetical protein